MAGDSSDADVSRTYVVTHLPGDGIGPEVTAVARHWSTSRQAARLRGRLAALPAGRRPLPAHRRGPAGRGAGRAAQVRRDPAGRRRHPGGARPACWSAACCCGCASSSTCTSTCARAKLRAGVRRRTAQRGPRRVVVRENTEGLYAGAGGIVHKGTPFETATEESLNTRAGGRALRPLRGRAGRGKRSGKLTLVHKTNVLINAGSLWMRVAQEVAAETGVQARLRARRRGLPVHGQRPGPVRRDRHRQPVRRHPHRPRRRL